MDVYDALVSKRVYRAAFSSEEALAMMSKERGKHFDSGLYDCFLRTLPELIAARSVVDKAAVDLSLHTDEAPLGHHLSLLRTPSALVCPLCSLTHQQLTVYYTDWIRCHRGHSAA